MLGAIPLADWLLILALVAIALLILRLLHKRGEQARLQADSRKPASPRAILQYVLELAGFALLSLLLIGGGVLILEDYQTMQEEIAPAPSIVDIPPDLAFQVEEVTFTTQDGLKLAGWYVPAQNGATVILLHGYGGNRTGMLWHAGVLVQAGYGVLLYDERASGESQGDYRTHGWQDAPDVGSALAYLSARPNIDPQRIGIAGCSIGGQIALQGAVHYSQLRAVWADGPAMLRAVDLPPPNNWATAITFLSNHVLDGMYVWRLGIEAPEPMITIIAQIAPRPILLVGGGAPRSFFGSEAPRVERYAAYAGDNAQVWVIPEARHCDGPYYQPEEYTSRLLAFFAAALSAQP
ncbi:MAG: CocE/NonD family hydrolase [Chloroflexota bacterium]